MKINLFKEKLMSQKFTKGEIYVQFEFKKERFNIDITEIETDMIQYNFISVDRSIYRYLMPIWNLEKIKIMGNEKHEFNNIKTGLLPIFSQPKRERPSYWQNSENFDKKSNFITFKSLYSYGAFIFILIVLIYKFHLYIKLAIFKLKIKKN